MTGTGAAGAAPPIWSAAAGDPAHPMAVLVHGSLDRAAGMLKLSRRLDSELFVVRYDRRGYGRSGPHPGPFGIEQQVDDLVAVIGQHRANADQVVVFGHSFGGNVALAAAQRHPDLVAGVVIYESPLSWLDWWPGSTAGGSAARHAGDPGQAAEQFMRRLIGDARWERLPAATQASRRAEGPAMLGELAALRRAAAWEAERITAPVVTIHGEHGLDHHRTAMRTVASWFGTEPIEIAGARHFGPNTHPDQVAAVVAAIARRASRPAGHGSGAGPASPSKTP